MGIVTVGHGALDRAALGRLLHDGEVGAVVDVRRFPGSRRNPDVARDVLAQWLPEAGIDYRWEPRLGGRRHLRKAEDARSPDHWWQVAAFRAYAGYTRTPEFRTALGELVAQGAEARVAIMCSEAVWWRCHRRIIADVLVLVEDVGVAHLMPDGRFISHEPAAGARLTEARTVVWDGE